MNIESRCEWWCMQSNNYINDDVCSRIFIQCVCLRKFFDCQNPGSIWNNKVSDLVLAVKPVWLHHLSVAVEFTCGLSDAEVEDKTIRRRAGAIFSTLIGGGPTMFCSHWLDLDHSVAPPAHLCHKEPAQDTQSFLLGAYLAYRWFFMA